MGAHNDKANDYQLFNTGSQTIADPGSGGTFDLRGIDDGIATIASGTRKLPNNIPLGIKFTVYASGSVTITTQASVTMATLTAGQVATFTSRTSTTWNVVTHVTSSTGQSGYIPLPLTGWREVTTNDITNAAGNGGVLATDSTPTLEYVNGDTDSQIRMLWAAANVDAIACQVTLPPDLDRTQDMTIVIRGAMSDTGDTPAMDVDTFFDEGDTKVEDATAVWGAGVENRGATIAAADIPDTATTMSIELTPGAHGTDTMVVYATYLTYTKR